jgi:L-ascorbate metabolism protein UlaG (beta-lactamase superfamily)
MMKVLPIPRSEFTMRRLLIALACLGILSGAASAQDKKLTIRWFGQSFFQIVTSAGTKIVIDPHAIEQYPRVQVEADLVLITHPHLDHSTLTPITNRDKAKVLPGIKVTGRRQDWILVNEKFKDVQVYALGTFHDKDSGMTRGKNTVFVIEADGLRFCHLGDLGHELTERQLQTIGAVDVLMIPVGGIYTINGTDAKKIMAQIKPKRLVLPMHYGTKAFEELVGPDEFLDGLPNVERKPETNEIVLDPAEKPPEAPKVLLLGWKKGGGD